MRIPARALTVACLTIVVLALSAATRATARNAAAVLDDAAVVAIVDLANTADIESGRLGAERARSKEVREYGTMLAQVHTEVRQKGRDLATKLGITPELPTGSTMAQDHQAAMTRLRALNGPDFERAFLQHEQAFHAAVIEAIKTTLLPAIRNEELKDFVTSLAPAFEAHRVMAEHLEHKLAR